MNNFQRPIFVLGSQRSGTTMLRLMLNAHPKICVPHESVFITEFYPKLALYGDLSDRDNAKRLLHDIGNTPLVIKGKHIKDVDAVLSNGIETYQDLICAVFHEYMLREGKEIWCDKTPFYTDKIDLLYTLFPEARFIHVVRDGRDVALSQKNVEWLANSLPVIAERWRWKTTICHKVGSVLPAIQYLELHYEDLVRDPKSILRRICDFIDVEFSDDMLSYFQKADEIVPAGSLRWHRNSVSAPDESKLYRWKRDMSRADQIIFEQVAGDALDLFGYERLNLSSSISSRLKNLYYNTIVRY